MLLRRFLSDAAPYFLVLPLFLLAGASKASEPEDRATDLCAWLDSHSQDVGAFGFCSTYRRMGSSVIEGRIQDFLQEIESTYGLDQRKAAQEALDRQAGSRAAKRAEEVAARAAARAQSLANIKSATDAQVCEFIHSDDGVEIASAEALRRKLFVAGDVERIKRTSVGIGMTEDALLCALGTPDKVNRTVNAGGTHKQYVYGGVLVYTDNGKVIAFQD